MEKMPTKKELRWFCAMMATMCAVAAALIFPRDIEIAAIAAGTGLMFLVLLINPVPISPFYRLWMRLAAVMGWVNTRILLGLMFFLVFTPIALARRALGHDPLELRFDEKTHASPTYWKRRVPPENIRKYFERQS